VHDSQHPDRLISRIESFSDLVIGFSLALLALTLTIPPHFSDIFFHPWMLIAYFWTFAVISGVWFNHQRLFRSFFYPEPISIDLNFLFLSMIGLIVYFVQAFVHYREADKLWAFLAYFTVTAVALIVIGTLYVHGLRRRWDQLGADDRLLGIRHGTRGLAVGAAILVGVLITGSLPAPSLSDVWPIPLCAAAGGLVSRLCTRFFRSRVLEAQS